MHSQESYVQPRKNAFILWFQVTPNVRFTEVWPNFKFNFVLRGQLVNLSLDTFLLSLLKILPSFEVVLVTLFLPLLLECSAEIV